MPALACLRILVGDDLSPSRASALVELVDRVVNTFLQTRWAWPRRFGRLAPFTFMLTDPSIAEIDVAELQGLSRDLHVKLFGSEGHGKVALLAFEGERSEVLRFAQAAPRQLREVLAGAPSPRFVGKISVISPDGVEPLDHSGAPSVRPPPATESARDCGFSGLYFLPRQTFVGSVLTLRDGEGKPFIDIAEAEREFTDAALFDLDLRRLEAAPAALARLSGGALYVPFGFSSIMHRAARQACEPLIAKLPRDERPRLAASLRGVPRDPSLSALAQIRDVLSPAFGIIDLHVADPYFEVGRLANEAVSSVTLVLPTSESSSRLAAIRHFMASREDYRVRRIWPAVTDVRTRSELAECARLRAPLVSGPAICDLVADPIPPRPFAVRALPFGEQNHQEAFRQSA